CSASSSRARPPGSSAMIRNTAPTRWSICTRSWNSTRWKIPIPPDRHRSVRTPRRRAHRRSAAAIFSLVMLIFGAAPAPGAPGPGAWQKRAPVPTARTEVAAAALDGKIYVIGGYQKGAGRVEEYDPAKNSWRPRAALPAALHHAGAAAVNGKLYVVGGFISGKGAVDTVYEYDPAAARSPRRCRARWQTLRRRRPGQRPPRSQSRRRRAIRSGHRSLEKTATAPDRAQRQRRRRPRRKNFHLRRRNRARHLRHRGILRPGKKPLAALGAHAHPAPRPRRRR